MWQPANNNNIKIFSFVYFAENKINYLFPIQSETFDYIYDGQDIIGQASKTVGWFMFSLRIS